MVPGETGSSASSEMDHPPLQIHVQQHHASIAGSQWSFHEGSEMQGMSPSLDAALTILEPLAVPGFQALPPEQGIETALAPGKRRREYWPDLGSGTPLWRHVVIPAVHVGITLVCTGDSAYRDAAPDAPEPDAGTCRRAPVCQMPCCTARRTPRGPSA